VEEEHQGARQPLRLAILEHRAACARVERDWLGNLIHQVRGDTATGQEGQRGLMILTGDLRDFHFPDLIKLIVSGTHNGTLTVSDGVSARSLAFQEGRPVCATSRGPDGEVSDPDRVMEDVHDLFRWQEGAFTFDQQMKPEKGCLVLQISAENLLLAGARWVDNWATIQRAVPSADTVFERRETSVLPAGLDLNDEERRILETLDGIADVAAVARACELTEFETSKVLYGLSTVGIVQPGDLDKIRLRRLFREFAELMCKGTHPFRASPDDFSCEIEVNQKCTDLPVRLIRGRIEDHTDPGLQVERLAEVYRTFLQTQIRVIGERFGSDVAQQLVQQVSSRIIPGLKDVLRKYDLV
jgi:hypothetical protein